MKELEPLLDAITVKKGWRCVLISPHFKAARRLDWPTADILRRKKTELFESELLVILNHGLHVMDLITVGKLTEQDTADYSSHSFVHLVLNQLGSRPRPSSNLLSITGYLHKFTKFTQLCSNPAAVGDVLLSRAKEMQGSQSNAIIINFLPYHSSICTSDIDECAEILDNMLDQFIEEKQ